MKKTSKPRFQFSVLEKADIPFGPTSFANLLKFNKNSGLEVYAVQNLPEQIRTLVAIKSLASRSDKESLLYFSILPDLGVECPALYGFIEDDDPRYNWILIEEVYQNLYEPNRLEHIQLLLDWVSNLHYTSAKRLDRELIDCTIPQRSLDFYMKRLVLSTSLLEKIKVMDLSRTKVASTVFELLTCVGSNWHIIEAIFNSSPMSLQHGDLKLKNMGMSYNSQNVSTLKVFDWEHSCWSSIAIDLGTLSIDEASISRYICRTNIAWPQLTIDALRAIIGVGKILRGILSCYWKLKKIGQDSFKCVDGFCHADWIVGELEYTIEQLSVIHTIKKKF